MTVRVDHGKCDGCGKAKESLCMRVCPGDLFFRDDGNKAVLREPRDCWDCAACLKECPREALAMYLPAGIGGRGSTLTAQKRQGGLLWTLTDRLGSVKRYFIATENNENGRNTG